MSESDTPSAAVELHEQSAPPRLSRAERRNRVEHRRGMVAKALLSRRTYRQIVEDLQNRALPESDRHYVALGTVASDVQALREQWRVRAFADYQEHVAEQSATIDALMAGILPSAMRGNLEAVDRAVKLLERSAKLRGLDAPVHHVLTGGAPPPEIESVDAKRARARALVENELMRRRRVKTEIEAREQTDSEIADAEIVEDGELPDPSTNGHVE